MRLQIRIDGCKARLWHIELLRRLAEQPGISAALALERPDAAPSGDAETIERLLRLERFIHGFHRGTTAFADAAETSRFLPISNVSPDLTIDLTSKPAVAEGRVWSLTFDGQPGEASLAGILIRGRSPVAAIHEAGRQLATGRLGIEVGGSLVCALQDVTARLATLILAALAGTAGRLPILPDDSHTRMATPLSLANSTMRTVWQAGRAAALKAYRLAYAAPHWRVGWRKLNGPDVIDLRDHPQSGWETLPDDGSRFYADPFPIEHGGHLFVFVEDFEHRLGRGVISAIEFTTEGPIGKPEPVLSLPYHLSYPLVFEAYGEVWMIPESCVAGTIDLFRATRFPGGWVKEATLVSGLVASDTTLVEHGGRWWMFATVRDGGGAFSDTLHLWSAQDFRGPWTPHPANPVLIDIASARPAGRFVSRDGVLFRPVQDCRNGYGAALAIARVEKLDDEGFAQTVETILTTGPRWPGRRLHTLNSVTSSVGAFEFIDGSSYARRRWWR
jgi:hypothetical protein